MESKRVRAVAAGYFCLAVACAASSRGAVGFGAGQSLDADDFLTQARAIKVPDVPRMIVMKTPPKAIPAIHLEAAVHAGRSALKVSVVHAARAPFHHLLLYLDGIFQRAIVPMPGVKEFFWIDGLAAGDHKIELVEVTIEHGVRPESGCRRVTVRVEADGTIRVLVIGPCDPVEASP